MYKISWEVAILKCINSLGGRAYLKQLYDNIGNFIELNEEHMKEQYGRRAYQNQVRSHIANLCQSGELVKISGGYYSLTKKGRSRIKR